MNISSDRVGRVLRWESVATIALAALVIPLNSVDSGIAKGPIFVTGAFLAFTLISVFTLFRRSIDLPPASVSVLIALHALLFTLSAAWSFDRVYTWNALAFGLACILLFWVGSLVFTTREHIDFLIRSVELITFVLCFVAAAQLFVPQVLPVDFHTGSQNRVPSLMGNSAYFSSFLIVVFPIILARTLYLVSSGKSAAVRIAMLVGMVLLLFATQTRSSIAGWACSVAMFTAVMWRSRSARISGIVAGSLASVVVISVLAFHPELVKRYSGMFSENRESTFARRTYFWSAGEKAFLASPLFGCGIGSFEKTVFRYRSPDYWMVNSEDVVPHAHNEIVEIATEYGCAGLLLCGVLLALTARRLFRLVRRTNGWERLMISGVAASLTAIAIDNLANVSLRQPPIAALAWLLLGLVWSAAFSPGGLKPFAVWAWMPRIAVFVPIVLFIGFLTVYVPASVRAIDSGRHVMNAFSEGPASPDAAIAELRLAAADDPTNLLARSNLALEYANAGRWDEALRTTGELQQVSPLFPKSFLTKGYALLRLGRYREALEAINSELRERAHPEAYWIQAAAYRAIADTAGERKALLDLIRKDIRGGMLYEHVNASRRLAELSGSLADRKEAAGLLDTLELAAPEQREFFEHLKE